MRFLVLYKPAKFGSGPPSPEYLANMERLIAESQKSGELVMTGGLRLSGKQVRMDSAGAYAVTDGPYAEAKELVGGFAILELPSLEYAVESSKQFLKVAGEGECEIREMMDGPPE